MTITQCLKTQLTDLARTLLQSDTLIILVDSLFHVDSEGTFALTLRTGARLDLGGLVLYEGAEYIGTFVTVILNDAQLGQNARR